MTRWLAAPVILALLALGGEAAAQAPAKSHLHVIQERGVLRVGTSGDFKPMSFKDPATNEYRGFDIDAARQLAADLGVKVEFVPFAWSNLISGLLADKFDIAMSGTSMTLARAKSVSFSDPYNRLGQVPLIRKENAAKFKTWEDLDQAGVTVAVQLGTLADRVVTENIKKATIRKIDAPARDYQELLANRVQAVVTSNVESAALIAEHGTLAMVDPAHPKQKNFHAYLLPQGDQVWINYVNYWVLQRHLDGFFAGLQEKYLGQVTFRPHP
jgi:cyclohexadienyl dehydratase